MKHFIRIAVAWLMVAVSLAMLTTASFAWFSMNRRVVADGIDMKVTAPGDLEISVDNENPNFDDSATAESLSVALGPASSADALNFFYAKPLEVVGPSAGQGHVKPTSEKPYLPYTVDSFQKDFGYQNNVYGFQDFKFVLRNTTEVEQSVATTFEFEHQTAENKDTVLVDCKASMRIAVFVNGVVVALDAGTETPCEAVVGKERDATVPFIARHNEFIMAAGSDQTIIVRAWLEGGEECIVTDNFTDPGKSGVFKFKVAFTI